MKITKVFSALFAILFAAALAGSVYLAVTMRNASPIMPDSLTKAEQQTERLMEAICKRNYSAAEKLLAGSPELNPERELSNNLYEILWEAYGDSLSYEFKGACYSSDYGLYRDVTVTMLDIPAVMSDLQAKSVLLLASRAAANPNTAYNADGTYREEFIFETLAQNAKSLIRAKDYTTTRDLTLQIVGQGHRWVIQADQNLMNLFYGGMGGA